MAQDTEDIHGTDGA